MATSFVMGASPVQAPPAVPVVARAATATPASQQVSGSTTQSMGLAAAAAVFGATSAATRRSRGNKAARAVKAVGNLSMAAPRGRQMQARTARRVATLDAPTGTTVAREDIRNMAIIAHVDHGKTTLTDKMMKQTSNLLGEADEQGLESMDSDQLEAERGITILAKNAALTYKGVKVNLIDTPGHADFGGEVERILNMADACLLLVDAQEGPMPQTKFVLRLALKLKKKVIVCINKVDKPAARPDWVLDTTFDLFAALGADDEQIDFPVVYASGFNGVASTESADTLKEDLTPLLDLVLEEVPKPEVDGSAPLQMMVSNLDYSDYLGRICIGRLISGSLKVGQDIGLQYGSDGEVRPCKVTKLWEFHNNGRKECDEVKAGDICAFSGMEDCAIGDTVVDPEKPMPLKPIEIEEPTVVMEFGINTSPLANKDSDTKFVTSAHIGNRLRKEILTNLALRLEADLKKETFRVKGRGTLQLGILIENMRREGYEVMIGPPQVILRDDPENPGQSQQPYEEVVVDTPSEFQGWILQEFQSKGAEMKSMETGAVEGNMVLTFEIPTGNLIGVPNRVMMNTKGTATVNSRFSHWGDYNEKKEIRLRENGSVVSTAQGVIRDYQLEKLEQRGKFWVTPGDEVYPGMCCGIHNKADDLVVNMTKEKNVTNVREKNATGSSKAGVALRMSLDDFLTHMDKDEQLEVTPSKIRLNKKDPTKLKGWS